MKIKSPIIKALYVVVSLVCAASLVESRLSVFAVLIAIIALASLSRRDENIGPRWTIALSVALGFATLGLGRFVFKEALPGIAEARGRDSSKKAVSLLREIYFAENAMRRYAFIDPDGDKVGGSATLAEMTGDRPARGSIILQTPPLEMRLTPRNATRHGDATLFDGHLVYVCVPQKGGGFTAKVESKDDVDEERAEREWVAYAWPSEAGLPHTAAYFIDAHERILVNENKQGDSLLFAGSLHAPPCNHAIDPTTAQQWKAWQGKTAREDLPGDKQ